MITFGNPVSILSIGTILTYTAIAVAFILGLLIVTRLLDYNKCLRMGIVMLTFLAWLYVRMPRGIGIYNTLPTFKYTFDEYISSVPFGNIAYSRIEPVAKYRLYIYLFYLTTFLLAFLIAKFFISLSNSKSCKVSIFISFSFLILLEVITLLLNFYQVITTMYDYASFILIFVGIILAWLLEKYKRESDKKGEDKV